MTKSEAYDAIQNIIEKDVIGTLSQDDKDYIVSGIDENKTEFEKGYLTAIGDFLKMLKDIDDQTEK